MRSSRRMLVGVGVLAVVLAACGSSKTATPASSPGTTTGGSTTAVGGPNPNAKEVLPPGDIPDTQVYVSYTPTAGGYSLSYPQGWAKRETASVTTFNQIFNTIEVATTKTVVAPTIASARSTLSAKLSSLPGFKLIKVDSVMRTAGPAIRIVYNATSAPDPVTGKKGTLDVERYLLWHNGTLVTITLSGAHGSDNVDPWKKVTNSFAWK